MSFTIARTVDEALAAMATGARPIAGGTDLVVGARHGKEALPTELVAIDRLDELKSIVTTKDGVSIGALVTHHDIETHPLLSTSYAGLADGSALVGSPSTRHIGTLGGNIMNASPAMDTGAPTRRYARRGRTALVARFAASAHRRTVDRARQDQRSTR